MKYAFLHKNFRELTFEKKVIFFSHFVTLVVCFFPWFEADPAYEATFFYNAFQGPGFLIGAFIFLISLIIVLLYLDRLFEKEVVKLPFSENTLYFAAGAQQVLLLVLIWSVLISTGKDFGDHEIRFGIFIAFIAQISGLVATFLNYQLDRQHEAKKFFQHPTLPLENNESSE